MSTTVAAMSRGARRLAGLLLLTALAAPASAGAATVSMTVEDVGSGGGGNDSSTLTRVYEMTYTAAPGEINDLTASATQTAMTVRDAGAAVTAGDGCEAVDAHTATCRTPPLLPNRGYETGLQRSGSADLGDGDDRFQADGVTDAALTVAGGSGDDRLSGPAGGGEGVSLKGDDGADVLTGGVGQDVFDGGPGADVLAGGAGGDALRGDPGADVITGGPGDDFIEGGADTDNLDGGAGQDSVGYSEHRAAVAVDLRRRTAGSAGEADQIRAFENVLGGEGDDVLAGTSGDNELEGGEGTDEVDGRAGDDDLEGERVAAGPGDDRLSGVRAAPDCGSGTDLIDAALELPSAKVTVPGNCERIEVGEDVFMTTTPRRSGGDLLFRVYVDGGAPRSTARITVRSFGSRRLLGSSRVRFGGGRASRRVRVRLTAAGERALRGGSGARLRVSFREPDNSGAEAFGTRLRASRAR